MEFHKGNIVLTAGFTYNLMDGRIVHMAYPREEVMHHLKIQTAE
jgi:hypothetical protein